MRTILIDLALILGAFFAAVIAALAILRAGIRRQEHTGCLTCRPANLNTAIARHVLGLYARKPGTADTCIRPAGEPAAPPDATSPHPVPEESAP
jgi:hypothetical protein